MDIEEAKKILGGEYDFTADFTNAVIQELELPHDSKILDIGTGVGNLAITLALNGYRVLTGEPDTDHSVYAKRHWLQNARKVGVDHFIEFRPFKAESMPFEDNSFDAIFSLGSFHHIDEDHRVDALRECLRTSKRDAPICLFEPNAKGIEFIKTLSPTHPDAADPRDYAHRLELTAVRREGALFDAFIFHGTGEK